MAEKDKERYQKELAAYAAFAAVILFLPDDVALVANAFMLLVQVREEVSSWPWPIF